VRVQILIRIDGGVEKSGQGRVELNRFQSPRNSEAGWPSEGAPRSFVHFAVPRNAVWDCECPQKTDSRIIPPGARLCSPAPATVLIVWASGVYSPPADDFSTSKLLVTEKTPWTPLALMSTRFLSVSLFTMPSKVRFPFLMMIRIGLIMGHA